MKAIKISNDIGSGYSSEYAHIFVDTGTVSPDDKQYPFSYCNNPENWSDKSYHFRLRCQIGGLTASGSSSNYCEPYAIEFQIVSSCRSDGIALISMDYLAKEARKFQARLARLEKSLGRPITFEEHATHLYLAWKPEQWFDESESFHWDDIDDFRYSVRHQIRVAKESCYPESIAA